MRTWLLLITVFFMTGCTFIGAGVGAAVPRYAETTELTSEDVGRGVKLDGADGEPLASGKLVAYNDAAIVVRDSDAILRVPNERVARTRHRTGSYWLEGALIGLGIDVTTAAVITAVSVYAISNASWRFY